MLTKQTGFQYSSLALVVLSFTPTVAMAGNNLSKVSAYQLNLHQSEVGKAANKQHIYQLKHHFDVETEAPSLNQANNHSKNQPESGYQMLAAFSNESQMYGKLIKQPFHSEIAHAAQAVSLDPALVHAVIYVESRYQASAVSPKGAIGLMQVMPATAARYGIEDVGQSPKVNIKAGTKYLKFLMRKFDNRLDLVLAAYNAGEGAVMKYGNQIPPYRETQNYVVSVLNKYHEWHQIAVSNRTPHESVVTEKIPAGPMPKNYLQGTRHNIINANLKSRYSIVTSQQQAY